VRFLKETMGCPDAYTDIHQLIAKHKPEAVLDIGCHQGDTIARILENNSVKVHGFEPISSSYDIAKSRFDSHPLVSIHQLALSATNGKATMHCNVNEQTNSLLDNDSGNNALLDGHTRHVGEESVTTQTLDDWFEESGMTGPILVKCDIQGAEGLLVEGGRKTLANRTVAFFSEAQISNMYVDQTDFFRLHEKLCGELPFVLRNVYPCFHDSHGRALQTDALWINESFLT
jgi:FkbM family methyltransferase